MRIAIIIAVIFAIAMLGLEAYLYLYKPYVSREIPSEPKPSEIRPESPTPKPTQGANVGTSEAVSVNLDTTYSGYFPDGDKCRQTYNEMFGDKTGGFSPNSACSANVTFTNDGDAEKKITIRKFDAGSGTWVDQETKKWEGKVTPEQFGKLSSLILANEAYKVWNPGISITARNVMITVKYADGVTKSPMSNVDEKTTVFLEMIDAFAALDRETGWTPKK